ncbi:MAG: hypothetical protein IJW78_03450 [Clostridia bacterium]|nr:hypothetical protein [Clostridia bacterium]
MKTQPAQVFEEYRRAVSYKESIGTRGIYEQAKMNERFYIGDQWHGAKCGSTRPLVRRNVIKRIGEYKMSMINSAPIAVNYSAEGIPNTADLQQNREAVLQAMQDTPVMAGPETPAEISAVMSALSNYFRVTAERIKFDMKKEQALRNAYITGTGIAFTYWDDSIETGLYADIGRTMPIRGDIALEILDVENVNFGDPNNDDVQSQPYITIVQRRDVNDVRREARKNNLPESEVSQIVPDGMVAYSGDENEPVDSQRVTVLTKLYKVYDKSGQVTVKAVRVTEKAYIRKPWDMGIKRYPIAKMNWERRRGSAYGESEITYLIPNQIAINRALTAEVWAMMMSGMPITMVNADIVQGEISNNPGQIVKVACAGEYPLSNAIAHVQPPAFQAQYQNMINDLASNTLSDSGANDAALGNLRPDNASAIIQLREAATAPMQNYMNRFYDFIEDIARIWADFWLNLYGDRSIKIEDKSGTWYLPLQADRYKHLPITAKIDVGAATLWSESVVIATLDNLLANQLITFEQYLDRLPGGLIPDVTGLKKDLQKQQTAGESITDEEILQNLQQTAPQQYNAFLQMPAEEQQQILAQIKQQAGGNTASTQEVEGVVDL